MRRRLSWRAYIGLAVLFVFLCVCGGTLLVHANEEIDQAESIRKELIEKKKKTEAKIDKLNKKKEDVSTYIQELDAQVDELEAQIGDTSADIEGVNREMEKAETALKKAKKNKKKQYESMQKRIKYMYENGSGDYFTLLLESESFSELLNRAEYIARISAYDQALFDSMEQIQRKIEAQEQKLRQKAEELSALKEVLDYEQVTVSKLLEDKNAELAKYQMDIGDASQLAEEYQAEIDQKEEEIEKLLEEERKRIEEEERKKKEEEQKKKEEEQKRQEENQRKAEVEKEAREAKQEQADANQTEGGQTTPDQTGTEVSGGQSPSGGQEKPEGSGQNAKEEEPSGGGSDSSDSEHTTSNTATDSNPSVGVSFRWPLGVAGKITSNFGNRESPTAGASTYHKGIDISAPAGTAIYAAAAGKVVTAQYSSSAGNYIMIYHGNSTYTVYMHCSSLSVSVGQSVEQGQAIGAVGSTGYSTGAHLHFGISINGSYVNPLSYVSP